MERKIDRFDKYMNVKGLNDNKVTLKLSLSIGTLGKSRKNGRDLSDRVIEQILNNYPDLNHVWLLTGEGEMLQKEDKEKISEVNDPIVEYKAPPETLIESQARLIRIQEQLVINNTKLVDTNNKLAEQVIELCNNQPLPGANELIEKLKNEIIFSIKDQLKNSPAQEDVGCANAG